MDMTYPITVRMMGMKAFMLFDVVFSLGCFSDNLSIVCDCGLMRV